MADLNWYQTYMIRQQSSKSGRPCNLLDLSSLKPCWDIGFDNLRRNFNQGFSWQSQSMNVWSFTLLLLSLTPSNGWNHSSLPNRSGDNVLSWSGYQALLGWSVCNLPPLPRPDHREYTILLSRERDRVNKGTKRLNSLPLSPLVVSFTLRDFTGKAAAYCCLQNLS